MIDVSDNIHTHTRKIIIKIMALRCIRTCFSLFEFDYLANFYFALFDFDLFDCVFYIYI